MRKILVCLLMLSLAACQHEMPHEAKPLSFEGPGYRFNVSRVDVVDDYGPAGRNHGGGDSNAMLASAMHSWADARLSAGGSANILELHITRADIVKKDIPKQKSGVEGLFTKEQTEEYDGKLTVELRLYTPERTLPIAHAEIAAEQSHTLAENATLLDRKALYRQITAEIMTQVDGALDRNIHAYFANYVM